MAAEQAADGNLAALLAPEVSFRRLLLVGTGALAVTHLPFWLNWATEFYPALELRIVLTRAATRFVAVDALAALAGSPVTIDAWDGSPSRPAPHLELAGWPDAVLVHPAGMNFIARLALGLADTPVQLALQLTSAVIGVAPALPPGHGNGSRLGDHLARLGADPRIVVGPTEEATSATTREVHDGGVTPVSTMFRLMQQRLVDRDARIGADHAGR